MSVCSQICQHPACWKAELELKREILKYGKRKVKSVSPDIICETAAADKSYGSLPPYKIINLLEDGDFIDNTNNDHSQSNANLASLTQLEIRNGSDFECLSTVVPNNSLNHKSFDCLKKLKKRQKEVENLEKENIKNKLNEKTVALKFLTLEDVHNFGGDFSKIFTWIPGKKIPEVKPEESDPKLNLKTIDGDLLPKNLVYQFDNKQQVQRSRSPTNFYKKLPQRLKNLFNEQIIDTYGFSDLLDVNFPFDVEFNQGYDYNQNVQMPSPLRTNRIAFHDFPTSSTFQQNLEKAKNKPEAVVQINSPTQPSLLYIKDGRLLSRSPSFVRRGKLDKRGRETLTLTRVSVPKKAIRKYPIFEHCHSSINKRNLSDVQIQPISLSEESSKASSRVSIVTPPQTAEIVEFQTQKSEDHNMKKDKRKTSKKTRVKGTTSNEKYFEIDENNFEYYDQKYLFDQRRPTTAPSIIQTSTTDDIIHVYNEDILNKELFLSREFQHEIDSNNTTRDLYDFNNTKSRDTLQSHSPSSLSKFSSGEMTTDKEMIKRTYDTYKSLTPYKTPTNSKHQIFESYKEKNSLSNNTIRQSPSTSNRIVLHESRRNLSKYLPTDDQNLTPNKSSFLTRSISPSISMTMRQQKHSLFNAVPSEIKVSQLQLNPSRIKSPHILESRKFKKDTEKIKKKMAQNLETVLSPIHGPPPTPNIIDNTLLEETISNLSSLNLVKCGTEMAQEVSLGPDPLVSVIEEKEVFLKLHNVDQISESNQLDNTERFSAKHSGNLEVENKEDDLKENKIENTIIIPTTSIECENETEAENEKGLNNQNIIEKSLNNKDIIEEIVEEIVEQDSMENESLQNKINVTHTTISAIKTSSVNSIDSAELIKIREELSNSNQSNDSDNNVFLITEKISGTDITDVNNNLLEEANNETKEEHKNEKVESENLVIKQNNNNFSNLVPDLLSDSDNLLNITLSENVNALSGILSESTISYESVHYQDFTEGLNLDLELDDEILKAMNSDEFNIDDFL